MSDIQPFVVVYLLYYIYSDVEVSALVRHLNTWHEYVLFYVENN